MAEAEEVGGPASPGWSATSWWIDSPPPRRPTVGGHLASAHVPRPLVDVVPGGGDK